MVDNQTAVLLIENPTTIGENSTDEQLIAAAKDLNLSAQFHLRKSVEEFWKLGEALSRLNERPSVKGRWREVLKEIGINHTTDNQARRLFSTTTLKKLAGYRNKTAALRDLGILSETNIVKKEKPDHSSKVTTPAAPSQPAVVESRPIKMPLADFPADEPTTSHSAYVARTPVEGNIAGGKAGKIITSDETEEITVRIQAEEESPKPAPAEMTLDPLTKITRIAANLEYLADDEFDLTTEFAAQIERAKKALDLLLGKGVLNAAA